MVAVCKAERGKPAANISWNVGNVSPADTLHVSHGFFTVESRLELREGMDTQNLSCVIRHPYWKGEKILEPRTLKGQDFVQWMAQEFFLGFFFFYYTITT